MIVSGAKVTTLLNLDVMDQPYRAFIQGGVWSAGYWWVLNSQKNISGGGYESNYINKYTSKGQYLGRMTLLGAGHGTQFCMIGDEVWVGWDSQSVEKPDGRDLRHVTWEKNRRVSRSQATFVDTGMSYVHPCPIGDAGYMTLRQSSGEYDIFRLRKISDLNGPDVRRIKVRKQHPPGKPPVFQGSIAWGDSVYVLYAHTQDNPQQLCQWKWGPSSAEVVREKPYSTLNITKIGLDKNFNSKEPEGLTIYKGHLVFGQRLGPTSRRVFRQYILNGGKVPLPDPPPPPVVPPKPPWPPVTPPKPPPPPGPCSQPPTVTTGLTGASGAATADGKFGTWRATPVTAIGTWINDPAIYPFGPKIEGCDGCGEYATWGGAADIGLAPGEGLWQGWDAEAAGVNDDWWRAVANNLQFFWSQQQRGVWYLRPYYEANGDWMEYSILDKVASFKTAFARTTAILREQFPECQVMLGVACSSGDPADRPLVSTIWPGDDTFDILSLDFYNTYPWVNTAGAFATKIASGAGANSLEPLRVLAQQHGKPVVLSEWGSAAVNNGGGGGDAPEFFTGMRNWISTNQGIGPGKVLMDVYFNVPTGYPEQYWRGTTRRTHVSLSPPPATPRSGEFYQGFSRTATLPGMATSSSVWGFASQPKRAASCSLITRAGRPRAACQRASWLSPSRVDGTVT